MNRGRLPWFACRPGPLLGALAAMEPHEGYVYCIVLFRIYEVGEPIADSDRALARRTGLTPQKVADALAKLCESGKLFRTNDGRLMNEIAQEEISHTKSISRKHAESGKKGGLKTQQNQRTQSSERLSEPQASVEAGSTHLHLHKDTEVSNDTSADVVGEEPKARLFRIGRTILVSFGISEKRTGALIGQWLKTRNDPVGLLAAIQFARDQNVAEPVAYISTVIAKEKPNGTHKPSLVDLAFELAEQARERERAAGIFRSSDVVGSH